MKSLGDGSFKRVLKKNRAGCRSPEGAERVQEEEDCSVETVFGYATFPFVTSS